MNLLDVQTLYAPGTFVQLAHAIDTTFNVPTRWRVFSLSADGAFLILTRLTQTPRSKKINTIYHSLNLDALPQTQQILRVDPDQTPDALTEPEAGPLFAEA